MTHLSRRAALAAALCAGLAAAAPAMANSHGQIRISDAWCPPPPPGAPTAAGYFTVTNLGRAPDRLIGMSSPAASSVQLHTMSMQGDIMRMRPVRGGLPVAPDQTRAIQPSGDMHLMLIGLKRPLRAGETAPVVLTFARAGAVRVDFAIHPRGAASPATQAGARARMKMGGR